MFIRSVDSFVSNPISYCNNLNANIVFISEVNFTLLGNRVSVQYIYIALCYRGIIILEYDINMGIMYWYTYYTCSISYCSELIV